MLTLVLKALFPMNNKSCPKTNQPIYGYTMMFIITPTPHAPIISLFMYILATVSVNVLLDCSVKSNNLYTFLSVSDVYMYQIFCVSNLS